MYALGCASLNTTPLAKLVKIKNVKKTKSPVSLVFSSFSQAAEYTGQMDNATFRVVKSYLPGPFTFIIPVTQKLPKALSTRNSIGIRIPNHEGICGLIDVLRQPLASASLHHADEVRDYTTDPDEIEEDWVMSSICL